MKKIHEYFTQILPPGICSLFGRYPGCKICWGYVLIGSVILGTYAASELLVFT